MFQLAFVLWLTYDKTQQKQSRHNDDPPDPPNYAALPSHFMAVCPTDVQHYRLQSRLAEIESNLFKQWTAGGMAE